MNRLQRGIRTYAPSSFGVLLFLLGIVLLFDNETATTGMVMMATGVLLVALSMRIMQRLNARRERQTEWILGRSGA